MNKAPGERSYSVYPIDGFDTENFRKAPYINSLSKPLQQKLSTWYDWCNAFNIVGTSLILMDETLSMTIMSKNPDLYNRIHSVLLVFFDSILDVNNAFVDEIVSIIDGKSLSIPLKPVTIKEWNKEQHKVTWISDVDSLLNDSLRAILIELPQDCVLDKVIQNFIQNSGKMLKNIETIFNESEA